MSRRIDIELTSSRPDGTWTWRAAGALQPKGVLDGQVLPGDSKVGDVFKVEAEADLDGVTVLSVVQSRVKIDKAERLQLIAHEKPFEPVTQQLAKKDRGRSDRGDRKPRRDGDRPRGDRRDRPEGDRGQRRDRPEGDRGPRPDRGPRRPRFEAPPEVPQRPKAKRLRPGNAHRKAVLAELPEDQRAIAEMAIHGMQTVRQKLREANAALSAEGKPVMPEAAVVKMAEELLPRLRVADWLDRAEAAKRDLAQLDLKDLRTVVAAANDPNIERSDECRPLAAELRAGLTSRTEEEHNNWLEDIRAALNVGRIVRALKLAATPPKAGTIFPEELGRQLADAATTNLSGEALPDRWIAVLEAVAFSPIRAMVTVASKPAEVTAELSKTVERLGALLPQIAAVFGIEVASNAAAPRPLRTQRPAAKKVPPRPPRPAAAAPAAPAADSAVPSAGPAPVTEPEPVADHTPADQSSAESPANEA